MHEEKTGTYNSCDNKYVKYNKPLKVFAHVYASHK